MIEEAVFLDTNVFMYAAGASHPYKEPSVDPIAFSRQV
jgi:predicted nucleic acid-binding protein